MISFEAGLGVKPVLLRWCSGELLEGAEDGWIPAGG